jgi:hypothetical protein
MHLRRQKGIGMSGWLAIIVIVLSVVTVGISTIPHYMDHSTIDGLITGVLDGDDVGRMNERDFKRRLERNMRLNNIREFELDEKITFVREGGIINVEFAYEVREPLFANVDLVMSFSESYEKVAR